jgi:acyl carrier protein
MSIKAIIISQIEQILGASRSLGAPKKDLPSLTDELGLLDSGLDSLEIAILVTRLEDTLGFDPFTESDITASPVTIGEFIGFYENAAKSS